VSLFSTHKPERSILTISLESGTVTVGLALTLPDKQPVVVYQVDEVLPFQEKVTSETLEKDVFQALEKACDTLVRDGLPHITSRRIQKGLIDEIHVVYASPWHLSQAKTLTITNPTPFIVTDKLVKDALQKETAQMVSSGVLEQSRVTSEMSIIEERVTDIALNEYSLQDPFGKKADRVTLMLFVSALEKRFRERVEEIVSHFVHSNEVAHHSLPLAFFATVRDSFAAGKDFLLVCAGEEITDIAYARGDIGREVHGQGRRAERRVGERRHRCDGDERRVGAGGGRGGRGGRGEVLLDRQPRLRGVPITTMVC
jgi:hypothetical protein